MSHYESSYSRRRPVGRGKVFSGIVFLVGVIVGIWSVSVDYSNEREVAGCTVTDKDRTLTEKGGSDMRVYTEQCGVLRVKDMLLGGEWQSADTFASIEVGKTYNFTVTGVRVGLVSKFPIIREVRATGV